MLFSVSVLATAALTASRSEHAGSVVQPPATVVSAVVLTVNVAACAEPAHASAHDTDLFDGDDAYFAWVLNGSLDQITQVFSHELAEACSDPMGDAWQVDPRDDTNWHEICDVCAGKVIQRDDRGLISRVVEREKK